MKMFTDKLIILLIRVDNICIGKFSIGKQSRIPVQGLL